MSEKLSEKELRIVEAAKRLGSQNMVVSSMENCRWAGWREEYRTECEKYQLRLHELLKVLREE